MYIAQRLPPFGERDSRNKATIAQFSRPSSIGEESSNVVSRTQTRVHACKSENLYHPLR